MNTAAGLRFLRALARLGESTPDYLEPRSQTLQNHRGTHAPAGQAASSRPVAPSIRLG